MLDDREKEVLDLVKRLHECSSKEIHDGIQTSISFATLKRLLLKLTSDNLLIKQGIGKATKYKISLAFELLQPIDIEKYYASEIDARRIKDTYNIELIPEVLKKVNVFTSSELEKLSSLQNKHRGNISRLSESEYKKELERLAIDLSWKSSQIEGNTYTLLETELLLKERETASGRTKDEAIMLLNHKEAIDFIVKNPDYLLPLTIPRIENIHRILIKELAIDKNIRKGRVGISGTNYRPLDNEFQIIEALSNMCDLVNGKENAFEKALLLLVLISYIQPFVDGNKRTARIISNAILMQNMCCPISFRTIDSVEYKKAMLLFYEQNNITSFKEIFINQFEFAVNTYF
ncbi:MAG: Fic family protein [Bacteroidales bacterium]|nr:MAG: Fic family protein [Bacteroidales bacterium]